MLEQQIADCENQLTEPKVAEDYKKAMELSEKLDELQKSLDALMLCWDQSLQELTALEGDEQ